jgi:diketogulonate reductase-like aldo/keto reductase
MPLLGFGTWQSEGQDAYDSVRTALQVGYRHLDTATAYRNEAEVGRAVRDSGIPREQLFITTKLPPSHGGKERQTIIDSLQKLGTEYVDLWLIHWPPSGSARPDIWQQLQEVRDEGLARNIGVSNYDTAQIDELIKATGESPAVNQIPWGPTYYDARLLAESAAQGVVVEGYSPFRNTNLRDRVLVDVAQTHGVTAGQVMLRWHIQHGTVVIPKSVTAERIAANFDVYGFTLSEAELARIDALGRP